MALTVQMVRARSRWKAMKIRWKARCWGAFQVEAVEARWKPRRSDGYRALRWRAGRSGGRMGGAVAGVSQELSLHLERRVATEVVY